MKNLGSYFLSGSIALFCFAAGISGAPVARTASGANAAAIQAAVDQFRTDLGGANNGVGNSFTSGRREINWDGVPDSFSAPNVLPFNFFNVNSPRGAVFSSTSFSLAGTGSQQPFMVSSTAASGTAVRFGNIDSSYTTTFQTFSAERLFTSSFSNTIASHNSNVTDVKFFIPGTNIPAGVNGFGAVFSDVDLTNNTFILFYDAAERQIGAAAIPAVPVANNGLSFLGVSFNAGERVSRVRIVTGNRPLAAGNIDGAGGVDVVAMDDFIYGEPRATEHHPSDFDGDGTSDLAVFRPSSGTWFLINSGSNTFSGIQFGAAGDVPIDGDFDGDARNDIAVWRPSTGAWFILNSSNGTVNGTTFGQNGDKPVAADYDKDGKTDIAVWRPSTGFYYRLNSSNGQFQAVQFGQNGDIPVQSALIP